MTRLFIPFLCSSILLACAAQPKYKEVDVEAELRRNSEDFTARHPESAGKIHSGSSTNSPATALHSQQPAIAKPSIMAIPAGTRNLNQSLELLKNDPLSFAAANAILGYLTKKTYPVISVDGTALVNDVVDIQNEISGNDEDLSYISSLSFGADVYIKFSYNIHRGQILANLGAYESTSGRMLGAQTATVNDNGTRKEELIASAMHKALPGLEKKIQAYFAEDFKIGVPYKVILRFAGDSENMDAVHSQVSSALKRIFAKVKINSMTEKTADITIYADAKKMTDAYEVFDAIQKSLPEYTVKKNSLVQKLLILEMHP